MWYQLVILKVTLFLTAGLSFLICECHFFPLLTVFGKSESDFSVLVNVWQRDGVTEILLPTGVLCAYVALSGICCSIWVLLCRTVTVLCVCEFQQCQCLRFFWPAVWEVQTSPLLWWMELCVWMGRAASSLMVLWGLAQARMKRGTPH